jgi:hypothetical protein
MSKSRGWYAWKAGARLPGGPGLGLMICCVFIHQYLKRDGRGSNRRSISVHGEIPTHTSCRSIWRLTRHPQTRLATHLNGHPLTVDRGAPLRLLVPVKLGLKNVKAITRITYAAEEPKD